jgi:hypothetical protein
LKNAFIGHSSTSREAATRDFVVTPCRPAALRSFDVMEAACAQPLTAIP